MTQPEQPPTPELDKQREIIATGESEAIGNFLDWCTAQGYSLWHYDGYPVPLSITQVMALYFELDLNVIETERRALLTWLQARDLALMEHRR